MQHISLAGLLTGAALLCSSSGCGDPSAAAVAPDQSAAVAGLSPAGAQTGAPIRVKAGAPQRKDLKLYSTQPAWIEAWETTPLYSRITGYVDEVLVDIGDRVTKDQVLLRLSVPELHDELRQKQALAQQAEAEVGQSQASLDASRAGVDTAQAKIEETSAGVVRAEATLSEQQAEYERVQALVASRSATQKLLEEVTGQLKAAEAGVQEATAAVQSARAEVRQSEAGVRKAEADLVAAQARLQVAQANVAQTETMLAYTEIKAPYDGVVTERNVDTGHYVQPSAGSTTPLLIVSSPDEVRVFLDVPEADSGRVDSGEHADAATIRIPALGNREITGTVTRTSWALDSSNRSLRVEIDCPNDGGELRPGMYATASILLEQRSDVLTIPATSIVRDEDGAHCYIVATGKAVRTQIEIGLRAGDDVEVQSGLDPDSVVVMSGIDGLEDGQRVELVEGDDKH
jgi:HlyD family secretion protein